MTLPEREKFTDLFDRASQSEQEALDDARAAHARRMKRDQEPDANGVYAVTECVECGEDIGEGRLTHAIKNTVCIHCQTRAERRR